MLQIRQDFRDGATTPPKFPAQMPVATICSFADLFIICLLAITFISRIALLSDPYFADGPAHVRNISLGTLFMQPPGYYCFNLSGWLLTRLGLSPAVAISSLNVCFSVCGVYVFAKICELLFPSPLRYLMSVCYASMNVIWFGSSTPAFLCGLLNALRDYTHNITVVESDGGSDAWTADDAFRGHGILDMCRTNGSRAVNLSRVERKTYHSVVGGRDIEIELPRMLVEESDFFITVPVPKVHVMTGVSLGFKNQWGCIPDVKRLKHHPDFAHKVLAINKLVNCRLAVFDGTVFLDGTGPMQGVPLKRDLLVAGEVGAASAVCCDLMGVDPNNIGHLSLAIREGLMPANTREVQITTDLTPFKYRSRLHRAPIDWLALAVFHSRLATNLFYNSRFASPIHSLAYALKGRPKDFKPIW